MDENRPLNIGQAAAILGVAVETVRVWAAEGKLPYFRTPGGHRRFYRADIDRLIPQRGSAA